MVLKKSICTTLFICILFTLLFLVVSWIFKLPILELEGFYGIRNKRIRIYQSDDIFDPDEAPEIEDLDPDDNPFLFDPDQQPMLNNQMNNVVLHRATYPSINSAKLNNF
jgi:hypothetical protein